MRDLDRFPHDYLVQRTRSSSRPSSLCLVLLRLKHTKTRYNSNRHDYDKETTMCRQLSQNNTTTAQLVLTELKSAEISYLSLITKQGINLRKDNQDDPTSDTKCEASLVLK